MKRITLLPCLFVSLLVIPIAGQGQHEGEKNPSRTPVVAGLFYSSDPVQLKSQLSDFFQSQQNKVGKQRVVALISPHAGYSYSGQIAASAFAQLNPENSYDHIFLLGSSHHVLLNGASIYNQGNYRTPLGPVEVDIQLANKLIAENSFFEYQPKAHTQEHTIEVQLPFLQYRLKKPFKIVPVIIGTQSASTCKKIADALKPYFNKKNLFIISSDFSHYPDYKGAVEADHATGDAIYTNSPDNFMTALLENKSKDIPGLKTSACGWTSILTLLNMSSQVPGLDIKHIEYKNSGDSRFGDKYRVVGYHSFAFTQTNDQSEIPGLSLSFEDKAELLHIARQAIEARLKNEVPPVIDSSKISETLKMSYGAFVTLNKNHKLQGCIGKFLTDKPLFRLIPEIAISSALFDLRFDPVRLEDLDDIEIEISVLSPLKPIGSIDEFELGKHGIYMVKGDRTGTFLPQVAESTHWSKEEFLGHCARDKARIGWDGWKEAELYTYEAYVFSEEELLQPKR